MNQLQIPGFVDWCIYVSLLCISTFFQCDIYLFWLPWKLC